MLLEAGVGTTKNWLTFLSISIKSKILTLLFKLFWRNLEFSWMRKFVIGNKSLNCIRLTLRRREEKVEIFLYIHILHKNMLRIVFNKYLIYYYHIVVGTCIFSVFYFVEYITHYISKPILNCNYIKQIYISYMKCMRNSLFASTCLYIMVISLQVDFWLLVWFVYLCIFRPAGSWFGREPEWLVPRKPLEKSPSLASSWKRL